MRIFGIPVVTLFYSWLLSASGMNEPREYWITQAKNDIYNAFNLPQNIMLARNLILFIGDGLGVSTVTAARILKEQRSRENKSSLLSFEKFPHIALSKTYNADTMVGDSAACATAMLSGVKANFQTLGVDLQTKYEDCKSMLENESQVESIATWAQKAGKWVGMVTTTRVTHATPAALFAHAASRYWENDKDLLDHKATECRDIARQLIDNMPGKEFRVILGGGRTQFLPKNKSDIEYPEVKGKRLDGRNLIEDWIQQKKEMGSSGKFIWNRKDFNSLNIKETDYLLGLFSPDHLKFAVDRKQDDENEEPNLRELTRKAIQMLEKNQKGYYLLVEGGRIDHAHHAGLGRRALEETLQFDEAVKEALGLVNTSETQIVVTGDHSHVFTIGGYPSRNQPILDLDDYQLSDVDGKPYTILTYGNGPGYNGTSHDGRINLTNVDTSDVNYLQQAAVPLKEETHGGEDVAIYAIGPMSHLYHGVKEQTYIAHAMAFSACIDEKRCFCSDIPMKDCLFSFQYPSVPTSSASFFNCEILLSIFINYFIMKFWL